MTRVHLTASCGLTLVLALAGDPLRADPSWPSDFNWPALTQDQFWAQGVEVSSIYDPTANHARLDSERVLCRAHIENWGPVPGWAKVTFNVPSQTPGQAPGWDIDTCSISFGGNAYTTGGVPLLNQGGGNVYWTSSQDARAKNADSLNPGMPGGRICRAHAAFDPQHPQRNMYESYAGREVDNQCEYVDVDGKPQWTDPNVPNGYEVLFFDPAQRGWNPSNDCQGDACRSVTSKSNPKGIGVLLTNNADKPVQVEYSEPFSDCNDRALLNLSPHGTGIIASKSDCGWISMRFVSVQAPPSPPRAGRPPNEPPPSFCPGPSMTATFTMCADPNFGASITVYNPTTGQQATQHIDPNANIVQCATAGYQAATLVGLRARSQGSALTICGQGEMLHGVNATWH